MRDFVILEFEFDSALFQFALRRDKILLIGTKRQMKHPNFAVRGRFHLLGRWEQGDSSISFANESRHAIPHAVMKPFESENVDVPFGGSFDVADTHCDVINSFELHDLSKLYWWRFLWIRQPRAAWETAYRLG